MGWLRCSLFVPLYRMYTYVHELLTGNISLLQPYSLICYQDDITD